MTPVLRIALLATAVSSATCFVGSARRHAVLASRQKRTVAPLLATEQERLEQQLEVWRLREGMCRGLFGALVDWKEDERAERHAESEPGESARTAFVASAAVVVVGAFALRLGGRAALVSLVGLDAFAEMGIGDSVDGIIAQADALGPLALVAFLAAWCVAKVFLIDFISIALAFSSGILFGGVFQGAAISAACATVGSLIAFQLSRGALQSRVNDALEKRPVARALGRVVEEDGFRTVFVLRLSPLLPIPLGAYSYIYGASKLDVLPFASATFLGSLKPYLVDSYAGVFSKQVGACG